LDALPESSTGAGPGAADNSPYTVEVTVTDDEVPPANSSVQFNWIVGEQGDLIAVPEADPVSGEVPLTVNFTGSNSLDDVGVTSYLWDFMDGTPTSSTADPIHTFTAVGDYDVELTVGDIDGNTSTNIVTIMVTSPINQPPVVTDPGDQNNFEGEVVSLQIEATDPESGVLDYAATGLPTGLTIDSGTGLISGAVSAGAAASSPFAVVITVTDDGNPTQNASVNFDWNISVTSNMPPIAVASANRNSGTAPLAVIFNGESSSDDVGIISYAWDFMDGSVSSEINPNHTFTTDGTYNVELTVTDEGGLTDTAVVTIVVGDSSNLPPVAILEATPISGEAPLEVAFVGSNSTDDNGIISYFWDFGDGNTSMESDPFNTFALPGEYTVVLTVTDADELTSTATTTIIVEAVAGEMMGIILNNPAYDGIAQIQLINQPSDVEVMVIYLHDSSGRLVGSYDPQDIFTGNSYDVPVDTVRTGLYYVGFEMSKGNPLLLKLLVSN
jgi:PKD repeat protein